MKKMKKVWMVVTILLITVVLSSVMTSRNEGGSRNPAVALWEQITGQDESQQVGNFDFTGQTLSISVSWSTVIEEFAALYMEANPGVTIEINNFDADWGRYMEEIPIQLMAGTADDLIDTMGIDLLDPSTTALLADWFPILRADPDFTEDNFFMNVFDAVSTGDRLFVYPMAFDFITVSANHSVPGLVDALQALDAVSPAALQELYWDFPAPRLLYLHDNHDAMTATTWSIDQFLDFDHRISDFNTPEFVDFITEAHIMTAPGKMFGAISRWTWHSPEPLAEQSQRYYFRQSVPQSYQFMLPFEEDLAFIGQVPFTNNQGQLVITPLSPYALNGRSEPIVQALAWDFLRFMQDPVHFEGDQFMYTMTPVYRPLLHALIAWELPDRISHFEEVYGWRLIGDRTQAVEGVIAAFEGIFQMPMANGVFANREIMGMVNGVMNQFNNGLLSAEQVAAELQERVSLALLELE